MAQPLSAGDQFGRFHNEAKQPHGVAVLMLTTEVMITEIPEEKKESAGGPGGHSHGGGMEGMY